ncbi:hypothetical protein [Paenibacillus xylanilyticus]|uniref:hypothetical protein n=1 Tax=Paenibacillus xylanilyticus TaxID=248903 RepID=UPI0039A3BDAB
MNKKTKGIIGVIGSLIVCFFGGYRLITETPSTFSLLNIPIVLAVTGSIGVIGNLITLKKLNKDAY